MINSFACFYPSCEESNRELQNEKILLTVGFEPPTFCLSSDRIYVNAARSDSICKLEMTAFYRCLLYLYHVVDIADCSVVYYIHIQFVSFAFWPN